MADINRVGSKIRRKKKFKVYDVTILFDGFPNQIHKTIKTNAPIDAAIGEIAIKPEISKGSKYTSSMAFERKEGTFRAIDKIYVSCPYCKDTFAVFDFDAIHVDQFEHVELHCNNPKCNNKFFLDRRTVW